MRYAVRYKAAAAAEVENAITRYAQPEINQASAFVRELERTEAHLGDEAPAYRRPFGGKSRPILPRTSFLRPGASLVCAAR